MKSIFKKVVPQEARSAFRHFQWRARRFGFKYRCVVCGARLRRFEPRGIDSPLFERLKIAPGGLRNVTCPYCHSYDRERLLYLYLRDKTDAFTRPQRILHFSPEPCIAQRMKQAGHEVYATVDLFPEPEVVVQSDICRLGFQTDAFDALICCHVLEHIPDDAAAMRELLRVLKPGGWAVLQVPLSGVLEHTDEDPMITGKEERLARFGQEDHVRVYGRDYHDRLRNTGWFVEIVDLIAEMGEDQAAKLGLFLGEHITVGRKVQ